MKILFVVPTVVAGTLLIQAQELRYTPGTVRYEQTIVTSGSPDPSGAAVAMQSRMLLTAAISAVPGQRDSLQVTLTIDSSTVNAGGLLAGQVGGVAPGTTVRRTITSQGRAAPPRGQDAAMAEVITSLFPTLAPNARVGTAWEDTLPLSALAGPGAMSALSGALSGHILRSVVVAKDTTYEGESAWKLNTGSELKVSTAQTQGLPVQVDASGGGTGFIILSKNGILLYSEDNTTMSLNVRMGGGASIPLETNTTRKVRRIR